MERAIIHSFLSRVIIRNPSTTRDDARNWRLLGFKDEIGLGGFARLDLDFLCRRAGFAMDRADLVFARRDPGNLEAAVFCRDRKIWMIKDAGPREHPLVNIALEFEKVTRLLERVTQLRPVRNLQLIDECITGPRRGIETNVVRDRV